MRTDRRALTAALLAAATQGGGALALAKAPPAVDPQALAALEKMGAFLRSQHSMKIKADVTTDEVLDSGQKIQHGGNVQLVARRPDRMRLDIETDRKNEQMFYDGKTFTVYQPKVHYYAQFAAPPTLQQLADLAETRYGIDLPLADLFSWGTDKSQAANIRGAMRIGSSSVDGVLCEHYGFHQADVDWQLWIEQGDRPLPRKLVVTTITEPTQPQHTVVYSWELSPKGIEDSLFTFQPPTNAQRIDFDSNVQAPSRQGRTPAIKRGGTP